MADYEWLFNVLSLLSLICSLLWMFVLSAVGYKIYRFFKKEQEDLRYDLELGHDTGARSGDMSCDTHSQGRLFTVKAVMSEINEDYINRIWNGGGLVL